MIGGLEGISPFMRSCLIIIRRGGGDFCKKADPFSNFFSGGGRSFARKGGSVPPKERRAGALQGPEDGFFQRAVRGRALCARSSKFPHKPLRRRELPPRTVRGISLKKSPSLSPPICFTPAARNQVFCLRKRRDSGYLSGPRVYKGMKARFPFYMLYGPTRSGYSAGRKFLAKPLTKARVLSDRTGLCVNLAVAPCCLISRQNHLWNKVEKQKAFFA